MSKRMIRVVLTFGVSMLMFMSPANATEKHAELAAGKHHEECFSLDKGDEVSFDFTAKEELRFNVHYHDQDTVKFPVAEQNATTMEHQRFVAPMPQTYCLMWSNKSAKAIALDYRYTVTIK